MLAETVFLAKPVKTHVKRVSFKLIQNALCVQSRLVAFKTSFFFPRESTKSVKNQKMNQTLTARNKIKPTKIKNN